MQLQVFRSLWGWQGDWAAVAAQTRVLGFAGIEARLPTDPVAMRAALAAEGLDYIAVAFTGGDVVPDQAWTPAQHAEHLSRAIDTAQGLGARFVNALAGNDRWALAAQVDFFGRAQAIAEAAGMVCSFETHRATSLFNPWTTLAIIEQLPDLRFTADLSHWVVVCERLLDHPADDLSAFVQRVHHVQARVGYDQGPQVPHPAAPEYAAALGWHLAQWQAVWAVHAGQGRGVTTLTPEFGPDGYTHRLPFTQLPIADHHLLNMWMARHARRTFADWSAAR